MNAEEFELLGRTMGDPWELAAKIVGPELKLITVTLGPGGAGYVAGAAFQSDPLRWPDTRHRVATPGPARSGKAPAEGAAVVGDPTGCGDVWGATFLARLLGGDQLEAAMTHANRTAAKNVKHRGASGLHRHLRGQLSTRSDV
jgi:sugar/nucleoside kinase (ribokinase family)